jgi:hypothetical protein
MIKTVFVIGGTSAFGVYLVCQDRLGDRPDASRCH